jgi:hypothetical protein
MENNTVTAVNKKIACVPPEAISVKIKQKNGLALAEQRIALFPLTVVYPSKFSDDVLMPGTVVFVRGEVLMSHAWAKEVYEIEGVKFVLVPEDLIWAIYEKPQSEPQDSTYTPINKFNKSYTLINK